MSISLIYPGNSRVKCCVPGCGRSHYDWKHSGESVSQGRQPMIYPVKCFTDMIDVCDIHFTVHDFYPWYNNKATFNKLPIPPHLRCARQLKGREPSLFLDEVENVAAQSRAKLAGEPDWWRLAASYDQTLDLDNLLEWNVKSRATNVQPHDIKPLQVFEQDVETAEGSDTQECREAGSEREICHVDDAWLCEALAAQSQEEEASRKSLLLFRTLCTSPLSLPNHWAVHVYLDKNYLIISKDSFSEDDGFVVERALRLTSDMKCPNIHVRGKRVNLQAEELTCVADVEELVEKLDNW